VANQIRPPASADSATQGGKDPTLVSGQDPSDLFGVTQSYSTGAPGSAGASAQPQGDPTNEPGQYPATEPISGVSLNGTGAPGSGGAGDLMGNPAGVAVQVTDPNYTAGQPGGGSGVQFVSANVQVGGPLDSTTLPGQYADHAAGNIPAMSQPTSTGAGSGSILHGGYRRGQR